MARKFWMIAIAAVILSACGSQTQKTEKQDQEETVITAAAPIQITVEEFSEKAPEIVGNEVEVSGTIVHVCKHGGKRMFIMNENPDIRLKIESGEDMAAFNSDIEGSDVFVKGIVEELRIDEEYLQNWENEVNAEMGHEAEHHVHTGEDGHEEHEGDIAHEMEKINSYREMLKESGKDHISFYNILCTEYEVK